MVRTLTLLATVAAVLALAVGPAQAITDGTPDGNGHPYVGLMVAQDATGKPLWRCSGTLLSSRLFLTAGHCTEAPAAHAEIWFASNVDAGRPANGYPNTGETGGRVYTHPQYTPDAFFLYDLGVVVLDRSRAVSSSTYGRLPTLNQLDALKPSSATLFTSVGYGVQLINPVFVEAELVRMVAEPHLIQINSAFTGNYSLMLSNNASTGGTCFGDSGGPNYLGSSNVIAGVTSFALNGSCGGTGGVFRLDRKNVLDFVKSFLN
jgi:V8-like Glu-specific endopeptidase